MPFVTFRFAAVGIALAAVSWPPVTFAAEQEEVVALEASVQDRLKTLLADYRPQSKTFRTVEVQEINNVGNFGRLVYYERQAHYSALESGLWAISSAGAFTSGAAEGVSQILSLCGLVTLITTGSSVTRLDTTTAIPLRNAFVPFGIRSSINVGRRGGVKGFRTNYTNVCSPLPGSRFSYQIDNEVQIKTSGLFGRSVTAKATVDVSCEVEPQALPATELSQSIKGEYLPVSCESTARGGQKGNVKYAFLKDPGLYVILSQGGGAQTTKVQYKAVSYEEQQ